MEPSENLSTGPPAPNDGDVRLSEVQLPLRNLPPVRRPKRPPGPAGALPHVKPFQLKSLYWLTGPTMRSSNEKPGFWDSVHLLSVFAGQLKGGKLRKPWRWVS